MKKIAIVGAGPTGVYTFFSLLKNGTPLSITIFERAGKAGVGMPYNDKENSKLMLANIASIEIPPLVSTYVDWLRSQDEAWLASYDVDKSMLHERQFLPRILLGKYLRDQFLKLMERATGRGFEVTIHECSPVIDLEAASDGVKLWVAGKPAPERFDFIVVATGHVWPSEEEAMRSFFPSPWSGLMEARIEPCKVGIMGTSLSAIDAAMAVVAQHGTFVETEEACHRFDLDEKSKGLEITLMSRSGILPEADFYCPIPYEPLRIATDKAIDSEIAAGAKGLLDRIFDLAAKEIEAADPEWSKRISIATLNADNFAHAYFSERKKHDPFRWAKDNLREVERNKRDKRTVSWRYAVLRLHEAVQKIVPHLNDRDRERFDTGLCRVFIDNYAAIPSRSVGRLLALREMKLIRILELGPNYDLKIKKSRIVISADGGTHVFDILIDARGQKPLKTMDLPFPTLREQLKSAGGDIPAVGNDYMLQAPAFARARIAFGALPYLMHHRPFVQGITASAEIGAAIAEAVSQQMRVDETLPTSDFHRRARTS